MMVPMSGSVKGFTVAVASNLADMKLPELKELARQMGLRGVSGMRKSQLVDTLQAARTGGKAPAGVTVGVPRRGRKPVPHPLPASEASQVAKVVEAAPVVHTQGAAQAAPAQTAVSSHPAQAASSVAQNAAGAEHAGHAGQAGSRPQVFSAPQAQGESGRPLHRPGRGHIEDLDLGIRLPSRPRTQESQQDNAAHQGQGHAGRAHSLDDILASLPDHSQAHEDHQGEGQSVRRRPHRVVRTAGPASASADEDQVPQIRTYRLDEGGEDDTQEQGGREDRGRRYDRRHEGGQDDRYNRHNNRRDRRHNNRDQDERDDRARRYDRRHERTDQDQEAAVLDERDDRRQDEREDEEQTAPVAGIIDLLDSYAFIRTSGYLPGPNDVYVSMGMVKKYGLRKGDAVQGTIRLGGNNHRGNRHQKFVPVRTITSINGLSVEEAANRPQFEKLTPIYPSERLTMETQQNKLIGRMIDIVSPIGKGQRGLIVSPPKAGKTITLQAIANAIHENNPECHIMVVLVDERPEEVTDMERTVHGEVISSTFDKPASEHTVAAEMAIERAKRLVEMGQDVVVLLDSMTRLARAYNIAAPASGRVLSGGVDAQALYPPKRFFGAARNIENGGSLTIIASALVETGSKMDEVIFEEFKGTGNMELRLSRDLSDKRMFPAIDVNASGTRREELLTKPEQLRIIYGLRRAFGGLEPEQVYSRLVPMLKKTPSNEAFFQAIAQQMNIPVNRAS